MKTLNQISRITDPLYRPDLDCIGMSCLIHYALLDNHIGHTIMQGAKNAIYNRVSHFESHCHMWIELKAKEGKSIIDYRIKPILGAEGNTPHGVFLKSANQHIVYVGTAVPAVYPRQFLEWMTEPDQHDMPGNIGEVETHLERSLDQWGWNRYMKGRPRDTSTHWLPDGYHMTDQEWGRVVVLPER